MNDTRHLLEKRYVAKAESLSEIRATIRNTLLQFGLDAYKIDPLVLAVNEACTNIIQHAYGPDCTGDILVEIFHSQEELVFRLTDFAPAVDISNMFPRQFDELKPGGLGIYLMRQLMDQLEFQTSKNSEGNILTMKKQISQNP